VLSATVAVALALTNVPVGTPPDTVSRRQVNVPAGVPTFFRYKLILVQLLALVT
jgi:hypothetical protein